MSGRNKHVSSFHIYGCNVQIVPNATHAIQIIHHGDGTILRTESCITPAASGRHESHGTADWEKLGH